MKYSGIFVVLPCVLFAGCADEGFIFRHQSVGSATLVAFDGSIRSVLVNDKGRFCAEPPPDAIGTIAKAIAAKATAKVPTQVATAEGSGEFSKTFESDIHELFQRSQGVQVLRDGMYRLCEAFVNGAIDQQIYSQQMIDLISTLDFVVPMELCVKLSSEERHDGKEEPSKSIVTGSPPTGAGNEADRGVTTSKSDGKVVTFSKYYRKPNDELMMRCFETAQRFAYDHNQSIVKREEANQSTQKALALRAILSKPDSK